MTESLIQPTRFGRDGKKTHPTTLVRVIRLTALQTVDGYASCAEYKVYADKRMLGGKQISLSWKPSLLKNFILGENNRNPATSTLDSSVRIGTIVNWGRKYTL